MILERTAFTMVVAMVLLAALVVAPAAARVDINTLEPGDTVYVGEENLVFGPAFGPESVTKLVHFSDPSSGLIVRTIVVSPPFELTRSDIGTTTGTYYAFNQSVNEITPANAAGHIFINIPSVALDVVLNTSLRDSVNGKSVGRDNILAFKLANNMNGYPGAMNIEVTLRPAAARQTSSAAWTSGASRRTARPHTWAASAWRMRWPGPTPPRQSGPLPPTSTARALTQTL